MLKNTIFVSECQGRIGEFGKERQEPAILKEEGGGGGGWRELEKTSVL